MTNVILVNEQDIAIGEMEKIEVHEKALLHRAFSIFVFNSKGDMLLHQRAAGKYHSPGLWTNTCCSHPQPGEEIEASALKRLQEEMGFTTPLRRAFTFIYKAAFDNGLTEHELDHVFIGRYDGPVAPNPEEVDDYKYESLAAIKEQIALQPQQFTEWFKIALPKLETWMSLQEK